MFFIVLLLLFSYQIHGFCPDGSIASFDGSKCWSFFVDFKDFVNAEISCRKIGGHLVSVHSAFEDMYLTDQARQVLTKTDGFMIGANNLNGNWSWTDGSKWDYEDWASGEPINSTTRNCMKMDIARGQWYVHDCFDESPYACETPAQNDTFTTLPPTTSIPCSYQNNSCQTIDIVFILQTSQSIDGNYFTKYVKQFVKDIGGAFYMVGDQPVGQMSSRVAVIEFATYPNITLPLVARTRKNFDKSIDDYVYYQNDGIKNISLAFQQALNIFKNADPPSNNTIAVLMIDSVTTVDIKNAKPAAYALRNYVYFLAGVGIDGINGNQVANNITNLATLIGNSNFAFRDINAAKNPTLGILPRALNIYPCPSFCKTETQKKQFFEFEKTERIFSKKLKNQKNSRKKIH